MVSRAEVKKRSRFWHGFIKASVWCGVIIATTLALMLVFLS